jgi:hypothetical protein
MAYVFGWECTVSSSLLFQESGDQLQRLYEKSQKNVGSILSNKFAKKFPQGLFVVTIDDLLNWDSWPVCISIRSKSIGIYSFT